MKMSNSVDVANQVPVLPQANYDAPIPVPKSVFGDQGGSGFTAHVGSKKISLKKMKFEDALEKISSLTGITKETLHERFIKPNATGGTKIFASMDFVGEIKMFASFFVAIWRCVIPDIESCDLLICQTGEVRKQMYKQGLVKEWTSAVCDEMNKHNIKGYYLLMSNDLECRLESVNFTRMSPLVQAQMITLMIQIGSTSTQSCISINEPGREPYPLTSTYKSDWGCVFKGKQLDVLEEYYSVNPDEIFRNEIEHLFGNYIELPTMACTYNAIGYVYEVVFKNYYKANPGLQDLVEDKSEIKHHDDLINLLINVRAGAPVQIGKLVEFVKTYRSKHDDDAEEFFQCQLLLELLTYLQLHGVKNVHVERKGVIGQSHIGGAWIEEIMLFVSQFPTPDCATPLPKLE